MNLNTPFNLTIFTDVTKQICFCSIISIIIIIIFIISPLKYFSSISVLMKIFVIFLLIYTIYLNNKQTNLLKIANDSSSTEEVKSQINMNIMCSYVFTFFIGLLLIFVIKRMY